MAIGKYTSKFALDMETASNILDSYYPEVIDVNCAYSRTNRINYHDSVNRVVEQRNSALSILTSKGLEVEYSTERSALGRIRKVILKSSSLKVSALNGQSFRHVNICLMFVKSKDKREFFKRLKKLK